MAKNIAFRIKVEIIETEAEPSSNRRPHEQADGAFSLVLPEADELNISALDRAAAERVPIRSGCALGKSSHAQGLRRQQLADETAA